MFEKLQEDSSKMIKNVSGDEQGYHLKATAVIEDGRIVSMSGNVEKSNAPMDAMGISFDAYRNGNDLKVNYHNIASDERETLDIISAMVDATMEKYEVK